METSDDDDKGHSITSFFDYINSLPPGNYKYVNGKFVRYQKIKIMRKLNIIKNASSRVVGGAFF